eukprot:s1182_g23.t1
MTGQHGGAKALRFWISPHEARRCCSQGRAVARARQPPSLRLQTTSRVLDSQQSALLRLHWCAAPLDRHAVPDSARPYDLAGHQGAFTLVWRLPPVPDEGAKRFAPAARPGAKRARTLAAARFAAWWKKSDGWNQDLNALANQFLSGICMALVLVLVRVRTLDLLSVVCDSKPPAFNKLILRRSYDLFWSHLTSDMLAMRVFVLVALWPLMEASASCAKSASLLSLKADMSKNEQGVSESNGSNATNGTACQNCSMSNSSLDPKLEELVKEVLQNDMNESADMPDPVGDATGGSLGQNLEFLYLKVAQLETAVELQGIEFRFAKQELQQAQLEIQTLKDRLDHKDVALKQVSSKCGVDPDQEPKLEHKHRSAWLRQVKQQKQRQRQGADKRTKDLLMSVLKKHHHQTQRRWGAPGTPKNSTQASTAASLSQRAAQTGAVGSDAGADLDRSVASKGSVPIVDDIVEMGEDVVDVVTDGTGLVGDALSDAYNEASDKVAFVANTVIDTVEQAIAILSQGFDWSANCPNWSGPSMSISESDISVDWGRQRCRLTLVGQTLTLFDLNFGTTTVNFPAPIKAMVGVGKNVESCLSGSPSALEIFKCTAAAIGNEWIAEIPAFQILFGLAEEVASCSGDPLEIFTCIAAKIGDAMLQTVPPFSILMQLGPMLSEFIAFFAELASALIHSLLSESTSLLQQAVQEGFPKAGEKPHQLSGPKGLMAKVRRQKAPAPSRAPSSLLQREARQGKPSNDVDNGIVGFGTTEAQPYASMLITQFGGDEIDSGSCLAFAPKHRTGALSGHSNVTQRDWQVPSVDSEDFVKLEPWAVPCDNQWAKDNPSKWEGYSFYTYESVIEKCAAITYSMSAQPVISFVGGLEFDLLPAPLMEVTTEVCWPDRVTAPDLSLIVFTARSAGIVLFTHTIRLHRRFGNDTDFTDGNFKDSVERPRNYFGKGTADDDDKALQVLSRSALQQLNASETPPKATKTAGPAAASALFRVTQEELFLASGKYDRKMGLNITNKYEGQAAVERVKAVLSKQVAALQEDEAKSLGVHELFELSSPSGSLVGFSVTGELAQGMLQLVVKINFGPVESPEKTIPLIDLVDNLRVVLAALPFVSQASKQKAIDAMSTTHFDMELPVSEVLESLSLDSGITQSAVAGVRDAVVVRKDAICSVQAALTPSSWGPLATLPAECRPSGTLVFKLPTLSAVAEVDVTQQGAISWMDGSQDTWLSLGGVVFPGVAPGWPLELVNGWSNLGGGYAEAKYTLVGSLCFLDGVIKEGTNWNAMAQLPAHCLPTKRLMFNILVRRGKTARVDVWPDGKVGYVGGDTGNWVSLSGIVFSTRQADSFLTLADGWVNNAGSDESYGTPSYSLVHGHCLLEGRVKGDMVSGGGLLTTLPVECWPMRKLIFSKAVQNGPIEVDVNQYGEVSYHTDTSVERTISLSGIIFSAPSDGKRFLPAVGAWYSDNTATFGDAAFYMTSGFCLVEARLKGGSFTSGEQLATLPEGCRPTKRLSFSVNHHKSPATQALGAGKSWEDHIENIQMKPLGLRSDG